MSNPATHKNHSFAEVIESSLGFFKAQSWEWDYFPAFGSLVTVRAGATTVFGIVYAVQTGSFDAGRYPFTYQKTEAELQAEQPQIFEFLQTTFTCLTIGFLEHNRIVYQVAPQPPKMHAFVSHATLPEITQFFSSSAYLHILFNAPHINPIDELLLALLRTQAEQGLLTKELFFEFTQTMTLITGDDYRRLKIFMSRAQLLTETFKAFS